MAQRVQRRPKDIECQLSLPRHATEHPAILVLHFWGGSASTFSALSQTLSQNHTVIAPSFRGWGESKDPPDDTEHSLDLYVADTIQLLASLEDLLTHGLLILGHSMGGKIAQMLLAHKDEIPCRVVGLVLVAPAPSGRFVLPEPMLTQQIHAYDSGNSARVAFEHVLLASPVPAGVDLSPLLGTAVSGSQAAKRFWPSVGMRQDEEDSVVAAVQSWEGVLEILVVCGALDVVETVENVQERVCTVLAEAGAHVSLEILSHVGHLSPVEAPEKLACLIQEFVNTRTS